MYLDPSTIERPWVFTAQFQEIYRKAKKRMFLVGLIIGLIVGLGVGRFLP